MNFPFCLLTLLAHLHVIGAAPDEYERQREDVDEFVREADRLFHALPGWEESLEVAKVAWLSSEGDGTSNREGYEPTTVATGTDYVQPTSVFTETDYEKSMEMDYDKVLRTDEVSGSVYRSYLERSSSAEETSSADYVVRTASRIPFTIDELGSRESDVSDGCLRDRQYITFIFRECIYERMEWDPERDVSNPQEPEDNSVTRYLKYCRKTPQLRDCVKKTILANMTDCLDEGMRETIANVEEVTSGMIRFICNKEADRIATFITDGSFTCLESNSGQILACMGTNLATHVLTSLFDLPSLQLTVSKCLQLQLAERCVRRELSSCRNRGLINIAAVVFNIAQEMASCGDDTAHLAAQALPERPSGPEVTTGGHVEDTVSPSLSAPSTTEQAPPSTSHAHNVSSSTANETNSLCHFEVSIVLLICTLIFGSMLTLQTVRRLLKNQAQKHQSVK